jgi:hypothetical protein
MCLYMRHPLIIASSGKITKRNRVRIPPFEIYQSPSINIKEVLRRRFNVIDRAVRKTRQQLMSQEDDSLFQAMEKVTGETGNNKE